MKKYKISGVKLNIISILIAMVLYIPAYFVQIQYKTIESLFCVLLIHGYVTTYISLRLSELNIKY